MTIPKTKLELVQCLLVLLLSTILVSGITVYHNERDESNDSDLYFNGNERGKVEDSGYKVRDADLPKNGELFEGDMVMDSHLRRAVLGEENKKSAVYSSEVNGFRHWPNGRIPYTIDDSLDPSIRAEIPRAIKIFNDLTCVRFVPKTPEDEAYVVFENGKGCSSSVGRSGHKQFIKLASGCHRFGTVQHEMMHSMGIIHEQSRPDRDEYVKVKFDNIDPKLARNFVKYDYGRADNLGTEYNYDSIMHYSNHAFSDNGEDTLVSKFDEDLKFGQRIMASESDIKQINVLYPHCTPKFKHADYLHEDMTAQKVIQRKRDQLRDEKKIKELLDLYLE